MDIEKMIGEIRYGRSGNILLKEVEGCSKVVKKNRAMDSVRKDDRTPYEPVEFEDTSFRLGTWYFAVDVSKKDDADWFTRVKPIEVKGHLGKYPQYVTVMCMVQDSTYDTDWKFRHDWPIPFFVVKGTGGPILYHINMDGNEILASEETFE